MIKHSRAIALLPALLIGWPVYADETGQPRDILTCLVRLELPTYPDLARVAHVQGVVEASFTIGGDGRAAEFAVAGPNGELKRLVQRQLARSRFKGVCVGQRLKLRVRFALSKPRTKFGTSQITLIAPDVIEVTTTLPELIGPQSTARTPDTR